MKIRLVVVGKLKEPFLKDMCNEYIKRLQAYASVEVVEVNDELALIDKFFEELNYKKGVKIYKKNYLYEPLSIEE